MTPKNIIALLTDFGTQDGYVGAMKGRILQEAAAAELVDISHEIEPFNIRQAAFCLLNAYAFFPMGTVFVVVVDPGVGTDRRGLVIRTPHYHFVGPDNGVFSFIYEREAYKAYEILIDKLPFPVSSTFHGRDVFAPLASWIVSEKPLNNYLKRIYDVRSFTVPFSRIDEHTFELEVLHIDRFGNIILNFHREDWERVGASASFVVKAGEVAIAGPVETFGSVSRGKLLVNWDSSGYLQIACNQCRAAEKLQIKPGDRVRLII